MLVAVSTHAGVAEVGRLLRTSLAHFTVSQSLPEDPLPLSAASISGSSNTETTSSIPRNTRSPLCT